MHFDIMKKWNIKCEMLTESNIIHFLQENDRNWGIVTPHSNTSGFNGRILPIKKHIPNTSLGIPQPTSVGHGIGGGLPNGCVIGNFHSVRKFRP